MKHWLRANEISLNLEKTELVSFKSSREAFPDEQKNKLSRKRLYPSNSVNNLRVKIDRFLHFHDQVNSIVIKLNRANALLLKIRNYVNMKTLRNIYFAIFDAHLSYSGSLCLGSKYQYSKGIDHSSEESISNNEFQRPIISFKPTFLFR